VSAGPVLAVALGGLSAEDAVRAAGASQANVFAVGIDALSGPGPGVIGALARLGDVFVDARLSGPAASVGLAARRLAAYGARWVTVDGLAGEGTLRSAVAGVSVGRPGSGVVVAAVPEVAAGDLGTVGVSASPGRLVSRISSLAESCGAEGVLCAPGQLSVVGEVAPGVVRFAVLAHADSAAEAIDRGCDTLIFDADELVDVKAAIDRVRGSGGGG